MSGEALQIEEAGSLTTTQDLGRAGYAWLGVPRSGALDPGALTLANRLVGNPEDATALEVTLGGLRFVARRALELAITGAPVPVTVDGRAAGLGCAVHVAAGSTVALGTPQVGVRSYVALRGGIDVPRVLGSASTDLLAGIGTPLGPGDRIHLGAVPDAGIPALDQAPVATPSADDLVLHVVLGPRDDWFTEASLEELASAAWEVDSRSNRVGVRLTGPVLEQRQRRELPSEGTIPGSIQVPHNGQPVLFLADHPVTGGYPVIAVVTTGDLGLVAQARPGQRLRFRPVSAPLPAERPDREPVHR